jgi:hypothetical protein
MRNWTRIGATALGASVLLVPTSAFASAVPAAPATPRPAQPGPPPPPHSAVASTLVVSLPNRERTSTSRATSIALIRLADTEQLL